MRQEAIDMGLFDKIFKKSGTDNAKKAAVPECAPLSVYTPADGKVIPLSEFPDEMFSEEVLGPGCGILPTGNLVSAPFNGTVTQVTDTLHAVGLTSNDGVEVLIHIGVDTVAMNGKGFKSHVKNDQKIYRGDPLITFDRDAIKAAGHPDAIAVVVTNGDEYTGLDLKKTGDSVTGELMIQVKK